MQRRGRKSRAIYLLAAAGLLAVGGAAGLPQPPASTVVKSDTGTSYDLQVQAVGGPEPAALLVVLDGHDYFATAASVARELSAAGAIPPTLLVGVSATATEVSPLDARLRDYTDVVSEESKPARIRREQIQTGKVSDFAQVLTTRIVPVATAGDRIDPHCRAVFGHSLAGLAVLHLLASQPRSFGFYMASSPSVWWGARSILKRLDRLEPIPAAARPRLLITVGALEQSADIAGQPGTSDFRMVENARAAMRVASARSRSVTASFAILAGRDHATAAREALRVGLLLLAKCRREGSARSSEPRKAQGKGGGK